MLIQISAPGRELFEEILDRRSFDEHDAVSIVEQILSALEYLHSKDIVHGAFPRCFF